MKKFPLAAVFATLCVVSVHGQENYATAWSGHKHVIVNTQAAGITAAVHNYPLLVRLDSTHASVFTEARTGGIDLRFTKVGDAVRLHHEIEHWDAAGRQAAIWVLVDTIPSARTNFALRMHWGNATAADSSNPARVFDTTNHFQAVWHMAGSANENDATGNAFTATQNGAPGSVPGAIGSGRSISGGNYFRVNGSASGKLNFPEGSNYTISAWVYTASMPGHGTILSKHDNAYALKLNADATDWEFFEYGTDLTAAGWNWVNAPAFSDFAVWRHITGVRMDFDIGIYVDGQRQDFGFSTAGSAAARVTNTDVVIGAQPTSNTNVQRAFDGILDEVRMSSTSRSENWIRLDFQTQRRTGSVVSVMDTIPASLGRATAASSGFSVRAAGDGLLFRIDAPGAARARITVTDMRGIEVARHASVLRDGELSWNGRDAAGRLVPQGVYAVGVTLLDARGNTLQVLRRSVAMTR